jgi:hypothetical protein
MAIYGIGCDYSGEDQLEDFINRKIACMGHNPDEYSYYKGLFKDIKNKDIIFLKSIIMQKRKLRVKAVGIVDNPEVGDKGTSGYGVKVNWINSDPDGIIDIDVDSDGGWQPRCCTIFREYNEKIISQIQNLISNKM